MKTTTLILVGLGAFLLWKRSRPAPQLAKVGELAELPVFDGTNFTADVWSDFTGAASFKDRTAPNLAGGANADPGPVGLDIIGLQPKWDGSL